MHIIIDFFIRKIRFTYMLLLMLIVMGAYSYINSPKEIFPPFSMGKILVSGAYGNGSIDNINKSIVSPIEDDLKNITGINKI